MATVNELITALGFTLKADAQSTISKYQQMISGVGELGKDVINRAKEYGSQAKSMKVWSDNIGMSVEELQKWERVAQKSGVEAKKLFAWFERLAETNIPATKIYEWADLLKKAGTQAERLDIKKRLGLDDEMFSLLLNSSDEMLKNYREARVISGETVKDAAKASDHMSAIAGSLQKVFSKVWYTGLSKTESTLKDVEELAEKEENEKSLFAGSVLLSLLGGGKLGAVALNVLSKLPILGSLIAGKGAVAGGAATAGAGAATGGIVGSAMGAMIGLGIVKAIYDELGFLYELMTKGVGKTLDEYEKFESQYDYANVAKWAVKGAGYLGAKLAGEPMSMDEIRSQYQDNRKTINVYVTTPAEVKDIIGDMGATTSTTPGGFAPLISQ